MMQSLRPVLAAAALTLVTAGAVLAGATVDRLAKVLLLDDVAAILQQEGLRHGDALDGDFLDGRGGDYFRRRVEDIYDIDTMMEAMRDELAQNMDDAAIAETLEFFDSERGQRILRLEVSARLAMADPEVEEAAADAYVAASEDGDELAQAVDRFVEINDLLDRNLSGALGSNYRFYRGLVDGGGVKMSEGEILNQVWGQEESLRESTGTWLDSFLYLAYGPLDQAEMQAYLDYSESAAGQALNTALFEGFEAVYDRIYYDLGRAVAEAMQTSEL